MGSLLRQSYLPEQLLFLPPHKKPRTMINQTTQVVDRLLRGLLCDQISGAPSLSPHFILLVLIILVSVSSLFIYAFPFLPAASCTNSEGLMAA